MIGKYAEIADILEKEIEEGLYGPGEPIPTIRSLAKRFSCSPQTVNKATNSLTNKGIIQSRQGSGSVVAKGYLKAHGKKLLMLIDRRRSLYLSHSADPESSHCRDIYLSYLFQISREGGQGGFIVYDKEGDELTPEFMNSLSEAEGYIIQGSLPERYIRILAENDIPAVFINRNIDENIKNGRFGSVLIDDSPIKSLLFYLSSLGHKKFLFIFSQNMEKTDVYDRRLEEIRSYAEQVFPAGYELEEFPFISGTPETISKLKTLHEKGFRAALAFNDISALRFTNLLNQNNLRVPEDFSVTGFDDLLSSSLANPPLTTIRVNRTQLADISYDLLKKLILSTTPIRETELLSTSLEIRQSCHLYQ
ncbi:MAG: substrate-binding domain-containing protein [Spirochaetales bacterium]|nr:substrate-binding domain-containing protein [Spirochaetales bacterium]